MLHKHPSAEQAQIYFGITEPVKKASCVFSKYLEKDIRHIYSVSVYQALKDHYNVSGLKEPHIAHIQKLLSGNIDDDFIKNSALLWANFYEQGVTIGEYIKLYQLLMSYFSAEAHKKYWFRYAKYRELNRSIRNLMLFDLAVGTSGQMEPSMRFVSDDEDFSTLSIDIAQQGDKDKKRKEILNEIRTLTLKSADLASKINGSLSNKTEKHNLENYTKELVSVTNRLKEINGLIEHTTDKPVLINTNSLLTELL